VLPARGRGAPPPAGGSEVEFRIGQSLNRGTPRRNRIARASSPRSDSTNSRAPTGAAGTRQRGAALGRNRRISVLRLGGEVRVRGRLGRSLVAFSQLKLKSVYSRRKPSAFLFSVGTHLRSSLRQQSGGVSPARRPSVRRLLIALSCTDYLVVIITIDSIFLVGVSIGITIIIIFT